MSVAQLVELLPAKMALIAAAMLTPPLAILYPADVDVYEDEPAWAMGLTLGWGEGDETSDLARGLVSGDLSFHGDSVTLMRQHQRG